MSNYTPKEGTGNVFLNENATPENKQPHFRGNATVNGKLVEIAAWKGVSQNGNKPMLSMKFQEPREKEEQTTQNANLDVWK